MSKRGRATMRTSSPTASAAPRRIGGTVNPPAAKKAHPSARQRAWEARHARRRRRMTGGIAAGVVVCVLAALALSLGGGASSANARHEVLPPPVGTGGPDVQPAALVVANPSTIKGVVAYDTSGWPTTSHNGPANRALGHRHVAGPVRYSVTPPVGGDRNGVWANCGVYAKPIPAERAVHDLEHGAVWITYRASLPRAEIAALRAFESRQSIVSGTSSRYVDLTPYPRLPSPIVISSWGFQLKMNSPSDPRLERFVDTFPMSPRYTPEYGGECMSGVRTPLER